MLWSVNIGSIAGTAIRVHVTFVLFLAWIAISSWVTGGAAAAGYSLAFMILLFACVVAHEFGHIFVARHFGVTTPTVTLLPIGGVAQLERIPENRVRNFWSRLRAAGQCGDCRGADRGIRRLARRKQSCRR